MSTAIIDRASFARIRRWLLYIVLATLPLERIPSFDINLFGSSLTVRIAHLAGVLLIFFSLPMLRSRYSSLYRKPWIWLWLFNLANIASAVMGVGPRRSFLVCAYTLFVSVMAWVVCQILEKEESARYRQLILMSGVAVCCFGLFQFIGDMVNLPTYITGLRPHYTKAVFGFPRIQSTALEPLFFANYLLIPLGIGVHSFFFDKGRFWYLPLYMIVLTLTLSRGGFAAAVALIVVSIAVALGSRLYRKAVVLFGAAVLSVVVAFGLIIAASYINIKLAPAGTPARPSVRKNLSSFTSQAVNTSSGISAVTRSTMREVALDIAESHLWFGVGPGNFGVYAHEHSSEVISASEVVNNEPLELLAEVGIIGTFFITIFAVNLLVDLQFAFRKAGSLKPWLWAVLVILVGFAVQYQTYSTLYVLHVWVVIGLALGFVREIRATGKPRSA